MTDLRLAGPVAVAWVSAVLLLPHGDLLGPLAGAVGVTIVVAGLAGVTAWARGRRLGTVARAVAGAGLVTAALVAVVCGSAAVRQTERVPPALVTAASHGASVVLDGTVSRRADPAGGKLRMRVSGAEVWGDRVAGDVPVFVLNATFPDGKGLPDVGDRVRVTARLTVGDPAGGIVFFARASRPVEYLAPPGGLVAWGDRVRTLFRATTAELPGDGGALLAGVSIGDTSRVDESLDSDMTSVGLTHLTAVSGANCAVLVGLVLLVGVAVGVPRLVRLGAAAAVLVVFVVLVTPEPSVLRAAIMALVALALLATGRPVKGLSLLATAVAVLLVIDPWLAREYGFALSVLATSGLVVLAGPTTRLLTRAVPEPIAALVAVPFTAQLTCQPLLITLDPHLPLHGILANVLAEPAAPLATVFGLASCLLGPVSPVLSLAVAQIAWVPSAWIGAVARFCAELPGGAIPWRADVWGVGLLCLLGLGFAAVVLTTPFRRSRRVAVVVLLAIALPTVTIVGGTGVGRRLALPTDWAIVQCDVGQGDAVLVRAGSAVALVDTGDDEGLIDDCLDLVGVSRIDLLVMTHFDSDHIGAAGHLAGRVEAVVTGPSDGADADRLVAGLRAGGADVRQVGRGDRIDLGGHPVDVLWPPPGQEPGNGASVVVALDAVAPGSSAMPAVEPLSAGSASLGIVLLGDLGEREQTRLLGRGVPHDVDVVKVSHHGSRDQAPALYAELHPAVALIGVGVHNTYGHPTPQTLAMLRRLGAVVERSDRDGTVALSRGARADRVVEVWSEGARVSAAARRLDVGAEPSLAPSPTREAERHGSPSRRVQEDLRLDRSASLASHSTGSRRARLGPRGVPRRSGDPPTARPAHRRRSEPRSQRHRGRSLRPG